MRRVERIQKCQLGWLKAHVENYTDEGWHAQVSAAIQRCIDAYDDVEEGYIVEYHRKVFGGNAAGRQFASCGMQSLYKPFRAAIARASQLTDWDIKNCHPTLLLQLCERLGVPCKLLKKYVAERDSWWKIVIDIVNEGLEQPASSSGSKSKKKKEGASRKPVGREEVKQLFLRILYLGGFDNWAKDVGYPGTAPPLVEGLVKEMRRVGAAIVKHYPELHKAILAVPPDDDEYKNPISRTLSIILGNIENDILMAARSYVESLLLFILVFVYDGFMLSDPDSLVNAEAMSEWVFRETNYRVTWEKKPLDTTIQLPEPITDNVVAGHVLKTLEGRVLTCGDISFSFKPGTGLWCRNTKPAQILQDAITEWSIEEKIFRGFDPSDYRSTVINLGQSRDMARVASWAVSLIPQDESFLKTKYLSTRRKIKFSDCVLDLATGQARPGFLPEEKFIVHVGRPLPPRV